MVAIKKRRKPKKPNPRPKIEYPPVPTKKWIPPDKRPRKPRPPPAYVKPEGVTQKLKISSLRKIWHDYEIIGRVGVLLGHFSQTHKRYSFKTNGYQGACNCAIACIFAHLHKMATWTSSHLDHILDLGDDLYQESLKDHNDKCLVEINPDNIHSSFFLGRDKISLNIDNENKLVEKVNFVTETKAKESVQNVLAKFFKLFPSGIFTVRNKHLGLWIQDDAYYLFDPTEHQQNGEKWTGIPGYGFSLLCRCRTLKDLVDNIFKNITSKAPNEKIEIVGCTIQRIIKLNTVPPENFEEIVPVDKIPASIEEILDTKESKAVDVLEERLKEYLEEKAKDEETSMKMKLEELSPEVCEGISLSKRPSWLQGSIHKMDVCKFPIPHKALPEKVSFYIELSPGQMGILRASTCQTDPNFSKYQGRQSMGNAISALIMLRFYKSKVWIPKIVNTILKYGDLLYRDAMITIPRTQSLKLSNFQKKTEYEGKKFSPLVEDYVVVGKLQSQDYEILDLLPALEKFLTDNESCVILGPLTLAVWVEEEKFFMFDPNERDKNGRALFGNTVYGTNLVQTELIPGKACVIWFTCLKNLVDLYMNNVEKSKRSDSFYLSRVEIKDYVDVPDPWYNFKGIFPNKWILRGTISQNDKRFGRKSRNLQSPACCLLVLAMKELQPLKEWSNINVDEVLDLGDKFYLESIEFLTETNIFEDRMLMLKELNKKLKMSDVEAHFEVDDCDVNGIINTKDEKEGMSLEKGTEEFFKDNDAGVLTCRNISVAIWKQDGFYYYFDSHDRDDMGLITGYGTACILRTAYLDDLVNTIEANLSPGKETLYNITKVSIQFCEMGEGDTCRPPLNNYTKINDNSAILRSLFSEISTKYDINCGKQTIPMCLSALTYNKLKPSSDWTKQDLDEILNKGDELYIQSMVELLKQEENEATDEFQQPDANKETGENGSGDNKKDNKADVKKEADQKPQSSNDFTDIEFDEEEKDRKITLANVKNEFSIGLNKFQLEFEDVGEGNIADDLKPTLQSFLQVNPSEDSPNQEVILESEPLSLAVWRDDKVFYVFDPKPRDKQGNVIGMEDWSTLNIDKPDKKKSDRIVIKEEDREDAKPDEETPEDDEFSDRDIVTNVTNFDKFTEGEAATRKLPSQIGEEEEQGLFEQEEEGEIQYFPVVHKSSSFWREKEKSGKAYTMWFTKVEDLIDHIHNNIPPKTSKEQSFVLKSVKITNTPQIKEKKEPGDERNDVYSGDWYDFVETEPGKWIMRGTMSIYDELFPVQNRGKQMIPSCYIALAVAQAFGIICFNNSSVDSILTYGDKLHTFVKRTRKKQLMADAQKKLAEDEIDWLLQHEEFEVGDVPKKICIGKFLIEVDVREDVVVGEVNAQDFEDVLDIRRGLEEFFKENKLGLLQAKDLTVAVWRGGRLYFMFDGLKRGPNGMASSNGTACITRYLTLDKMANTFLANLSRYGRNSFSIHSVKMGKDICPRQREPKQLIQPPKTVHTGGFQEVLPGKCIVRGTINQNDPKFGKEPGAMSSPIAVIALTMTLLHKTNTWSKPIIDNIIELGAELYDDTLFSLGYDFNAWEDKLDIYRVKNDYKIGVLKANCEMRMTDQKGIIDIKDSSVPNLRKGMESFFEENTHGILVTEPLTVAIWEEQQDHDEPLIYVFDPYPRGPTGMPIFTGTACLVTCVNAKMAAEHLIGCILDSEKKMGEFTIVPVEIVVGDAKTPGKVKRKATKSDVSVLPRCSKLVAGAKEKILRKLAEFDRKKKAFKRLQMIGRKGYYPMSGGDAILRGYKSQNSEAYAEELRNQQDIPNCIAAVVMHHIFPVDSWTSRIIDQILDAGNQLYVDSYIAYGPKDKKLGMENVVRKFFLQELTIHVTIYKPIISEEFTLENVNRILNVFFQQEPFCILNYADQWVSVFFKSGQFYVFDPRDLDVEGNTVKKDEKGVAAVLRCDNVKSLALKLVSNLSVVDENADRVFTLWIISVEIK